MKGATLLFAASALGASVGTASVASGTQAQEPEWLLSSIILGVLGMTGAVIKWFLASYSAEQERSHEETKRRMEWYENALAKSQDANAKLQDRLLHALDENLEEERLRRAAS
ncbi:MAG: hypothetical protein K0U98_11310 [Deltaproteobacteria bacterium]|nr:hypothetical protein [Deltaproteobacteria bacterium]